MLKSFKISFVQTQPRHAFLCLFFYLKYTPAGLFQDIRLNQKLNQENDISKQYKNFFG